jgi:hypothetical protein
LALRRRVEVAELLEQQWVLPGESILRSVLEEAHQGELEAELLDASKHGPRKSADRLAPAERLLDALSLPLAHRIAGMSCGTAATAMRGATKRNGSHCPHRSHRSHGGVGCARPGDYQKRPKKKAARCG